MHSMAATLIEIFTIPMVLQMWKNLILLNTYFTVWRHYLLCRDSRTIEWIIEIPTWQESIHDNSLISSKIMHCATEKNVIN